MEKIDLIRNSIISTAKKYVGKKEVRGNKGFLDPYFQQKMEAVGWKMLHAWCAYFAELVWCEAYGKINSMFIYDLQKLFSANAVRTYNRLVRDGFDVSDVPEAGDLAVWQSYKNGKPRMSGEWYLGHIAIVISSNNGLFETIEGNSNSKGEREGIEVAEKKRKFTFDSDNGLRLIGFIKPKVIRRS